MIYKANPSFRMMSDKEASIIGPVLTKLVRAGKGTPCEIVKAAEPENSKLHFHFTWDDAVAGFNWRKQEARVLVNAVVTVTDDGVVMPLVESLQTVRFDVETDEIITTGRIYKLTTEILSNPDNWEMLKLEISHSLNAMRRKLKVYQDFVTTAQTMAMDEAVKAFDK